MRLRLRFRVVDEEMDLDLMEDEDAVDSFVDTQIKKGMTAMGSSDTLRATRRSAKRSQVRSS